TSRYQRLIRTVRASDVTGSCSEENDKSLSKTDTYCEGLDKVGLNSFGPANMDLKIIMSDTTTKDYCHGFTTGTKDLKHNPSRLNLKWCRRAAFYEFIEEDSEYSNEDDDCEETIRRHVLNLSGQSEALVNTLLAQELILENYHEQNIREFSMAATAQNTNNTTIRSILQQEKLTGPNIMNWYRNLRIVLRPGGKLAHLEQPLIHLPLPRALENYKAYDMIQELKTMFEEQVKEELFEIVKLFHACKQEEGQSVSSYLLKMKSYLDTLERLGYAIPNELGVSLILNSLSKEYDQFIQNYNMHSMGKTIAKLHAMLKLHEKGIPKKVETPVVLAIREGKIQKDKTK
ncbi:hypothetical protein Tco_0811640, partial [Tanacetum coccineum]